MKLSDFDYHLPEASIAQYPLSERDSSRLLVLHRKTSTIEHRIFRDIADYLNTGDVLILNNAKVLPARLIGRKKTAAQRVLPENPGMQEGRIELLLLREVDNGLWQTLVKGNPKGAITFGNGLEGEIITKGEISMLRFHSNGDTMQLIRRYGLMPLPPYIKRQPDVSDRQRYQTVYAEKEGAIAAPTAGLHFTEAIIKELEAKGVIVKYLTLYVGLGTFRPIRVQCIEHHRMDAELFDIPEDTMLEINKAKKEGRRVIAVGTTSTRAIEGSEGRLSGSSGIFIYPGYRFRFIDALITNFHLPRSTPLMLVSALSDINTIKRTYMEAVKMGYRFFSYGDAMLII